jgi:hypothetical protein
LNLIFFVYLSRELVPIDEYHTNAIIFTQKELQNLADHVMNNYECEIKRKRSVIIKKRINFSKHIPVFKY